SNVVAKLNLNVVWGKKFFSGQTFKTTETMDILKGRMQLAPVRNTKIIAITVYSDDANEASQLANAIVDAYSEYRLQSRKQVTEKGLAVLQQQYDDQSQQIQAMQTNVDNLRKALGISDIASAQQVTTTLPEEQMRDLSRQVTDDTRDYNQLLGEVNQLKTYDKHKLRVVLPSITEDSELSGLLSKLNESEQEKARLLIDYNPTNLVVVRVQSLLDTLNRQIDDRVDGAMAGFDAKVKAKKDGIDAMTETLDDAKAKDLANATRNQPYYDAKFKLTELMDQHRLFYAKMESDRIDSTIPKTSMVQTVDIATASKIPVKPNKPLNIILGLVFGLIMGVGLAFFIEYLDTSVKTIDDVERIFQAPVLGVIPQNIGYLLEEGPESKNAEAYRVLRTNLLFTRRNEKFNTIVIVSAGAGEGKSTTTLNLSTVFAQAGNRVLIVDSDLRRPTLHKLFKVPNNLGLTNYLLKQNSVAEVVQTTPVPNLDFMPSGKLPNSSIGILGSEQMKEMINELKQRYDFIFFDSPPILGVSDASVLASEVDLVMQVIQYRRYPQPMTIRAKQMIEKVGGNFVGIVLNNINMSQDEGYYYYSGYYHDYYYSRNPDEQEAETKAKPAAVGDQGDAKIKQKY
ncbi:MAG TPA: polysaccharide biosynthesis tyrosine autokinase, partial [Verrucomicrobiae bacterium]